MSLPYLTTILTFQKHQNIWISGAKLSDCVCVAIVMSCGCLICVYDAGRGISHLSVCWLCVFFCLYLQLSQCLIGLCIYCIWSWSFQQCLCSQVTGCVMSILSVVFCLYSVWCKLGCVYLLSLVTNQSQWCWLCLWHWCLVCDAVCVSSIYQIFIGANCVCASLVSVVLEASVVLVFTSGYMWCCFSVSGVSCFQ